MTGVGYDMTELSTETPAVAGGEGVRPSAYEPLKEADPGSVARSITTSWISPLLAAGRTEAGISMPTYQPLKDDVSMDLLAVPDDDGRARAKSLIGGSEMTASVLNIANSVMGAAFLGLPYAWRLCGYVVGNIVFVTSAILAGVSLYLLYETSREFPRATFDSVCQQTCPRAPWIGHVVVMVTCLGAMMAYLVVIGSVIPDAVQGLFGAEGIWISRYFWISVIAFGVVAPVSTLKSLDALTKASAFAVIPLMAVMVMSVVYAVGDIDPCGKGNEKDGPHSCVAPMEPVAKFTDVVKAFPIFVFAFSCHQNMFQTIYELRSPTPHRARLLILYSLGICSVVYLAGGMAGYKNFGTNTVSNILDNYDQNVIWNIARIAMAINVTLSYPLQNHPFRNCASEWFFGKPSHRITSVQFYGITFTTLAITYTVAMITDNLGIVMSLTGAIGAALLDFSLPGWFYMRTHDTERGPLYYIAMFFFWFGNLFCVFGTFVLFYFD